MVKGRDNKKTQWGQRLFFLIMGMFLLAGFFGLLTPETALAVGGDITITGAGLNGSEITITQAQLQGEEALSDGTTYLAQQDVTYSTINTYPTKSFYRGKGVKVIDLLDAAGGLNENATLIKFSSSDGFSSTLTVQEFLNESRYFYPNIMSNSEGHIPGDTSGAVLVEPIIAHSSCSASDLASVSNDENLSGSDANHLLYGQRAVTEQTNARFAKKVNKIEVLTDSIFKWDNPTADPVPGEVPAGTLVRLSGPFNDEDKVHYTLDGSDPTIESLMYNLISYRWWSLRQSVLDQINTPIEITEDTTIKAKVIGPGKADSDIVEFTYTVEPPAIDILYEGTVALAPDETFTVTAYNSSVAYTVYENTPLGALQTAANAGSFTYDVTDKNYAASGALLLDNVGDYERKAPGYWYAYVNDIYKDGYNNAADALNLMEVVEGDKVEFYYAAGIEDETDLDAVKAASTAAVKTVVDLDAIDILYEGPVALAPDETFTVTAYNSSVAYTVYENTPLGALQTAANAGSFTYDVTDKNYAASGSLLLDNVGDYERKAPGYWYAYVNDVYKDGYNNAADALNLMEVVDGDKVEFYYAAGIEDETDLDAVKAAATAAVKIIVDSDAVIPTTWNLLLKGAKEETVTKDEFEQSIACPNSGHQVTWTDGDGNVWGGIPLWLLVAVVDDDPDVGSDHFNFNDDLADQNYEVNVVAGDGWKATFDSATIARNDGYIVANTLNGEPLPLKTESGKDCWPLYLKGSAVFGGQQVGNIVKIELTSIPEPPAGWTLEMLGEVGDTITQEEFEEGLACTGSGHYKEWVDNEGNTWSGVPLWVLLGAVDDIEAGSHWTFNDSVAANGYSVTVYAGDDFNKTFDIADVKRSDNYIIANKCNDQPLTDSAPLRLVGAGVTKTDGSLGGSAVGNIVRIEIPELQTPEAEQGSWNLTLKGKISDVISQAEFEAALACPYSGHLVEWTDGNDDEWSGIPLWFLTGWVDDREPHAYDANQANAGYTILVKAGDGYTKDFSSEDIAGSEDYIIASKCNGVPLTGSSWPLRLVGDGVANDEGILSGTSVGNVVEIELTSFETVDIPELHIVKYGVDGTTVIAEETVDYLWMESNLEVIGDGETVYRYEGITNNPDDVWDADETNPGGYKIANAVKGTLVKDLCELVGGMGAGTEIVFVASDGYETRLPYSSIYTDPSVQARQGDAILAWWGDGEYVPDYRDGMRLFFIPEDEVYGQWDMHETLPENYWHYYYSGSVQYPSCAGLSAKLITEIEIYSVPQGDWTLELDGKDIGGIDYEVSKTYFESALACQFGANHKAAYTDDQQRVWEGMPLWFLAGFVDDADQHSDNAFNSELALNGYQVVITAEDGYSITIDSADIIRNNNYIIANSLNGAPLSESGDDWPLKLVGPAVTGSKSISQIVSIKLVRLQYSIIPEADDVYTIGETQDGIKTMTVKTGQAGFKYFTVSIEAVKAHTGTETVVFTHLRNGAQLELNATTADFDQVGTAKAGFNVKAGDVVKVYIVNQLINDPDVNPTVLQ